MKRTDLTVSLPCGMLLMAAFLGGCSSTPYQSPAPSREEVSLAREQVAAAIPERETLTLEAAADLAKPVFDAIADDAARICRTVAEADSCGVPAFDIVDVDTVNARAAYTLQNDPQITLTRGLVEQLADRPEGLALVIGHEYGHLIAAHVGTEKADDGTAGSILGAALTVLAAASPSVSSGNTSIGVGRSSRPSYRQREIDEYLAENQGAYEWFSRSEEFEADYIGTYLAARSRYLPDTAALIEFGALKAQDDLSPGKKQDRRLDFAYWDTHPFSPERAARIRETLKEIEQLKAKGFARPLPPRLIVALQNSNASIHSLEELVAPLP